MLCNQIRIAGEIGPSGQIVGRREKIARLRLAHKAGDLRFALDQPGKTRALLLAVEGHEAAIDDDIPPDVSRNGVRTRYPGCLPAAPPDARNTSASLPFSNVPSAATWRYSQSSGRSFGHSATGGKGCAAPFARVSISGINPSFHARRWSCQTPNDTRMAAAAQVKTQGHTRLARCRGMILILEASLFRLVAIL